MKLRFENVPESVQISDVETLLQDFLLRGSGSQKYFDKKLKKHMIEVEFMLHEEAHKAFGNFKGKLPWPKTTLSRSIPQTMGRVESQDFKKMLRIRAGGLSRGSAIIVCKSNVDAQQVAILLNGALLNSALVRARISNKADHEVRLDGLTEQEDEAVLFREFGQLSMLDLLHDADRCIIIHCMDWIHDDAEAGTWFRNKLQQYGEIQNISVRTDKRFSYATVTFKTEQQARSARLALDGSVDLFDSILTLPCDAQEMYPNFVPLPMDVANKFTTEINAVLKAFNCNPNSNMEAVMNRATIQIKPQGDQKRSQFAALSTDSSPIQGLLDDLASFSVGKQLSLPASSAAAFSQGIGRKFLQELQNKHKVVVKHHLVGNTCNIYGPRTNLLAAVNELQLFAQSIEHFALDSVALSVSHYALLQRSLSQDLSQLRPPGDTTTSFAYNREQQILNVHGEQVNVDIAVRKIESFRTQSVGGNLAPPPSQFGISGCVICGTSGINLERDRLRVCGHVLCPQCLHDHFIDATIFPVFCPGGSDQRCTHSITLRDAERVLSTEERMEVSRNSVKYMLARQRKQGVGRRYRPCPTPGCAQLYVATKDKLKCDTCGKHYCLSCARATGKDPLVVQNHPGETCDEYLRYNMPSGSASSSAFGSSFTLFNTNANNNNNTNNSLVAAMSYRSPMGQSNVRATLVPPPSTLMDGGNLETLGMLNNLPFFSFDLI